MPKKALLMMNDSSIVHAREMVERMKKRGFLVFYNPQTGIMLMGDGPQNTPSSKDMDEVYGLNHEIGLLFAIHAITNHFVTLEKANKAIDSIRIATIQTGGNHHES